MAFDEFLSPLSISNQCLRDLAVDFSRTYRHLALHSTEQFLATPINVLPMGTEEGHFLAIEVGGSNLRVGFVELLGTQSNHGSEIRRSHEQSWSIEDHFKMDNAEQLFSWIGSRIALVVAEYLSESSNVGAFPDVIPLGITFSFPMMQASISQATLMPMGKGFAITSELDLGTMLLHGYSHHVKDERLLQKGTSRMRATLPNLKIVAITNDTVATLACLSYSAHAQPSSRVAMGLIVGTGTNSSIVMDLNDLHEDKRNSIVLPTTADAEHTQIVVNTEWTIRGAAGPIHNAGLSTRWDQTLDCECEAPGFQPFEYMTAGRYLGELARLILYDYLVRHILVREDMLPHDLCRRNAISTLFLSNVIATAQTPGGLIPTLQQQLPSRDPQVWDWTGKSSSLFIETAKALRTRSLKMISAAAIGLLTCAGELQWKDAKLNVGLSKPKPPCQELIIAYAGGVVSSYPNYLHKFQSAIDSLVSDMINTDVVQRVILKDANNGGLLGAGVLAGTVWALP